MKKYESKDLFVSRHIGPREEEVNSMLNYLECESLDELIKKTIPAKIRLEEKLNLDEPLTEYEFIDHLRELAGKNKVFRSYIGMGYYSTVTPAVIQRNIFENPGWYTQYTPYQAEISQGRLEAVINFQTMVSDLTGMELANASLLDEGTAAAEAMAMLYALRKKDKLNAHTFFVSDKVFPHTLDVLKTRATPIGIKLKVGSIEEELTDDIFGILVQYPDGDGRVKNFEKLFSTADQKGVFKAVASDLLSLTLLTPPGEFGADVVVGSAQRFGVPMGYGGPHAAFFATKEEYKRQIPGRIIGASIDSHGNPAYRMALQTREQHIRREKATSNICTAQVLLAIMAGMYAVYHGPKRLKAIAQRINNLADLLNRSLNELGFAQVNDYFFDTLKISIENKDQFESIQKAALKMGINFRYFEDQSIGISLGEKDSINEIKNIIDLFSSALNKAEVKPELFNDDTPNMSIPENLNRKSEFLTHEVFNKFHSETEMMRYIKRLERKDLSLTNSMIPLGSCTMKLNAATEMVGVSLPEFAALHPFIPKDQAEGYRQLFKGLEDQLCKITGFDSVSLQPNSGAQGEFAGLMVIRAYHISRRDEHRNVILIPSSAHGTNPASAVMAGGKVVVVKCDENGNIDLDDLRIKAEQYKETLSALMVTYPSTHGVFEEEIRDICKIVHDNGGQVYMDGANLNAQVGLTNPAIIGADVCHINLHKTFCIPHGGGGPGMGPIAVAKHLTPFLPGHSVIDIGSESSINAISAAPWGSSSILLISYAYIKMMGGEGLTYATEIAILNANYIRKKLEDHFKVLYVGRNGNVGHELIFDLREFKSSANIEVEDVAKRLMDYGFHAPTVSFPVPGTVMVEPTESESKDELDRFCDAMISIRNEIEEIANGKLDKVDNPLKNSPHTVEDVVSDDWSHNYSREKAAFPLAWVRERKFWPSVGRVDNAYGDRNLVCSCLPISDYEEEPVN